LVGANDGLAQCLAMLCNLQAKIADELLAGGNSRFLANLVGHLRDVVERVNKTRVLASLIDFGQRGVHPRQKIRT
jgi:hypothetical protein